LRTATRRWSTRFGAHVEVPSVAAVTPAGALVSLPGTHHGWWTAVLGLDDGSRLWQHRGAPLEADHERVVTTSGEEGRTLTARDLATGDLVWRVTADAPVVAWQVGIGEVSTPTGVTLLAS